MTLKAIVLQSKKIKLTENEPFKENTFYSP